MSDDIVDRLNASYEFLRDPLHLEARDEIERLRTDNEHIERMWLELINNCRTKSAKIMQAHSEIERLRAALQKYADEEYNGYNACGGHARAALDGEKTDD